MALGLNAVSMLNALSACPIVLRARHDLARQGRVSLMTAIWAGVNMHLHAAITFATAFLDRGSMNEPSLISVGLGLLIASIGVGLIRRRAPGIRKSGPGLRSPGRQADYQGHLTKFAQFAVCGLLAHDVGGSRGEPLPLGIVACVSIRAHRSPLREGRRGASPPLRIRRNLSRLLQQDTPVPVTQRLTAKGYSGYQV